MYLTTKNLTTLAIVIALTVLLSACNSESSYSSTNSGGGSSDDTGTRNSGERGKFSLFFKQTVQPCHDCSVYFDTARLVIEYSGGTYSSGQSDPLHIRKDANAVGRFYADLSSIPESADIITATLYMRLNPDEGIANSDNTSVVEVFSNVGGQLTFLRYITAREDIKGKGYSKLNPVVPIDFTSYAQQL